MALWQLKVHEQDGALNKTLIAQFLWLLQPLHGEVFLTNLKWRWRCLVFLPTSWQDVWRSDGLVRPFSSLGFLWTNKKTLVILETDAAWLQWMLIRDVWALMFHKKIYSENCVLMFVVLTCLVSGSIRSKNALTVASTSSLHLEHRHRHIQCIPLICILF